jgi:hypothetical protein
MKIIFDHTNGFVIDDKIFCEVWVELNGEKPEELLQNGFLPSSKKDFWYQAQSCRINCENITLSYKRRKIISKLTYDILNYGSIIDQVDSFFSKYMENRNLSFQESYKKNSELFELKVMEIKLKNKVVAYVRFSEFDNVLLQTENAYDTNIGNGLSLGTNSMLLLSLYGNSIKKKYTYIYESYKDYFSYKMTIPNIEYWEGEKWMSCDI